MMQCAVPDRKPQNLGRHQWLLACHTIVSLATHLHCFPPTILVIYQSFVDHMVWYGMVWYGMAMHLGRRCTNKTHTKERLNYITRW